MTEWLVAAVQAALAFLEAGQYPGLAIFIALEGAGLPSPVPAELVTATMGYQVFRGRADAWILIPLVAAAATLGNSLLYWLARVIGRPLLDRYGRLLRIRPRHVRRLERWFNRRALAVVMIGRVLPAIRIVIPVIAGAARGDFRRFLLAAFSGNALWAGLYVGLGWALGDLFETVMTAVTREAAIGLWIVVGVVVLAAAYLVYRLRRRIFRRTG